MSKTDSLSMLENVFYSRFKKYYPNINFADPRFVSHPAFNPIRCLITSMIEYDSRIKIKGKILDGRSNDEIIHAFENKTCF